MRSLVDLIDTLNDHDSIAEAKRRIKEGENVNVKDEYNTTALHVAALNGHLDLCKMMVERGVNNISAKNDSGYTPLDFAVKHNYIEIVNFLREEEEKAREKNAGKK